LLGGNGALPGVSGVLNHGPACTGRKCRQCQAPVSGRQEPLFRGLLFPVGLQGLRWGCDWLTIVRPETKISGSELLSVPICEWSLAWVGRGGGLLSTDLREFGNRSVWSARFGMFLCRLIQTLAPSALLAGRGIESPADQACFCRCLRLTTQVADIR